MPRKTPTKKSLYNHRLYWHHVSTTLRQKYVTLKPLSEGFNRSLCEPFTKRICVAPTIEQCITAVPYILGDSFNIYRTKNRVIADHPKGVFDVNVTQEGWLHKPTKFVKLGRLKFIDVENGLNVDSVIEEAASSAHASSSGKVLKWWKRAKIKRFIKKA